jgi:hypothetical protein
LFFDLQRIRHRVEVRASSLAFVILCASLGSLRPNLLNSHLGQQLAELEAWAERSAEYAHGRGKSAKGQDLAAVRIHDEWANRFRRMRSGAK